MVRRYGRRHRGGGKSLVRSLEKLGTGVAFVLPAANIIRNEGLNTARLMQAYTGYNINARTWKASDLFEGWAPIVGFTVAKAVAHKAAGLIRRI